MSRYRKFKIDNSSARYVSIRSDMEFYQKDPRSMGRLEVKVCVSICELRQV
ncbi:MAG: hypothetical protein ACRCZO_10245 [Cetobacterium sp.]